MSTTLVEILGEEPVTLDQAKRQCYIPTSDPDLDMETLLNFYIEVARGVAENWTWRGLINATYRQTLDSFPDGIIEVEKAPLQSVTKIEYYAPDGTLTEMDSSDYRIDKDSTPGRIEPVNSWPSTQDRIGAVQITFEGGYKVVDGVSTVPEPIKGAILMLVKMYFDNRDAVVVPERTSLEAVEIPFAVRLILDSYSLRTFA